MATFRKSASKTRAALESTTALPPTAADILDHAGEQAARMTNPAKAAKSARKAASVPAQMPSAAFAEAAVGVAHAAEPAAPTSLDTPWTAVDLTPQPIEQPVAASEASVGTTQPLAEASADAAAATTDLTARSIEDTTAEVESVMTDIAAQVSHATDDILRTTTDLTAQTSAGTAAEDMTSATADVAATATEVVAAAIDSVGGVRPPAGSGEALGEFNARLADLFREHLEDSLAFFAAMTAVRSVPEAFTVNQQHFQRRLDVLAAQSRDLTLLAGKVAAQTLMPFTPAAFR